MTELQFEIAQAVASGETVDKFANRTGRTRSSLYQQIAGAGRKLGANGIIQIVLRCLSEGWLYVDRSEIRPEVNPQFTDVKMPTPARTLYILAAELHTRSGTPDEIEASSVILRRARDMWMKDEGAVFPNASLDTKSRRYNE